MGPAAPGGSEFDQSTVLTGDGPVFGAVLDGQWNGQKAANGGFLLALATRAIGAVLRFPDPVVVSGTFLRPGLPGPAEIRTEVIQQGRTTGFGQGSLYREGKEVLRATAAFSDLAAAAARDGRSYTGGQPPELPPPEQCPVLKRDPGLMTLVQRVEYRLSEVPAWLGGTAPPGTPLYQGWVRFADGREPDLFTLPLFADAMAPAACELGIFMMTTVQLTVHLRARPAPGWLAFRIGTRFLADGYFEEDVELWDSAGRLVAQSRQLALVTG